MSSDDNESNIMQLEAERLASEIAQKVAQLVHIAGSAAATKLLGDRMGFAEHDKKMVQSAYEAGKSQGMALAAKKSENIAREMRKEIKTLDLANYFDKFSSLAAKQAEQILADANKLHAEAEAYVEDRANGETMRAPRILN